MFALAILIGIYSYVIFSLGLLGLLYKNYIAIATLSFIFITIFYFRNSGFTFQGISLIRDIPLHKLRELILTRKHSLKFLILILIFLQALVNFIGVLGPELSFDSLWYHLTLPKLYLLNHSVFHIPGGLLYYSDMPKLTEMLYVAALAVGSENLAKFIHFSFGILTSIAIFKLSRKFFSSFISLIAVLIFYSNLVVGWESTASFVDLSRSFFEVLSLWAFINWVEKKEIKWLIESAVMLGLAITAKLLAVSSISIFLFITILILLKRKKSFKEIFLNSILYLLITILIPLPWFVFSFINTGNPIHPFFTKMYDVGFQQDLINPLRFLNDVWILFTKSSDPVSPLYLIFLPLVFITFKKLKFEVKIIGLYSVLALIVWYIIPRTGGGRFILPYLPVFSIIIAATFDVIKVKEFKKILLIIIIFVSIISIIYRGTANKKYLSVVSGRETKEQFLSENLNFSYGDFYDIDGYFKTHIKTTDKVLLFGFHNLYYIDFPFIDSSWVRNGDKFNYIAVQDSEIPQIYKSWDLIYTNPKTHVKLYSMKGRIWVY
ncbi:MAG: glycosyltransferase family 39 protein [Candidatus Levybacteria bacterium]|nr:glycosyltransferase family 39 protein [Candidatus Levybacteria bacterium]